MSCASAGEVTRSSGSNFLYSFLFLSKGQRREIHSIYAFARLVDDGVDEVNDPSEQERRLQWWAEEIDRAYGGRPETQVARELQETIEAHYLPREYFDELIRGCEMDIRIKQYESFDQLELYCYRVASTIGLMCLPIFGCSNPQSKTYAVLLGKALQMSNILRDVGVDAEKGRIYLPHEDLERFSVKREEILKQKYSERFCELMQFEAERARNFYRQAREAMPADERRNLLAARIMGRTYQALLDRIVQLDYQVFGGQLALSKSRKLVLALSTWTGIGSRRSS